MTNTARIPERVALSAAMREFGERMLAVGAEWFTAQGWDAVEGNVLGVALDGGASPFVTEETGRLIRSVWAGIGGALMTADAAGAEKH